MKYRYLWVMINLFDFSLQLKGFPITLAQNKIANIQDYSLAEKEVFIENQKQAILDFHLKNNPFYQKMVTKKPEHWHQLPIMTKACLQQPLKDRLSNGYKTNQVYRNKTSGSCGHPFIFAIDKPAHAITWANTQRLFGQYGIDFNYALQARFYGMPLDFFGRLKEQLKDFLSHRKRFVVFDLSDDVLEKYLNRFYNHPFKYLNGYASAVLVFAKFLNQKNKVLKTICPSLKVVICTSEMLFEDDKILMQNAFGVPVVNEYGASELGIIAFENPQGLWEVNQQTLFLEVVDDSGNPLPLGKQGRLLATALFNKAHPFIRYEIGDSGSLDYKNNTLVLQTLLGRNDDWCELPSGKKIPGLTFYYITKGFIDEQLAVREFVVFQTGASKFLIEYVCREHLLPKKVEKIQQLFDLYLEKGLEISIKKVDCIKRDASGKLKQFVNLYR